MIKYAERGLVNNGSVSPLFEILYYVVYVSLFSVFLIFATYNSLLSKDSKKKSNYHLVCIKQPASSDFKSTKSLTLVLSLTVPFFIILISMFCSIIYFLPSNKRNSRIIGNYRRNVLSLKETFLYTIIMFVLWFLYSIVLRFHTVFGFSVDEIRWVAFTHSLVVHQLLEGIIWPIYILWNMHKQMPELFSEKIITEQKFYNLCQHKMEPRRAEEKIEGNIQRRVQSDFTFQQNKNIKKSISKLPPIVI